MNPGLLAMTLGVALAVSPPPAPGQKKPSAKNETRGTTQVRGAYVRFGETYSLKNGLNLTLLKAAYTMENVPCYEAKNNTPTEKLVVFDVAVKNWMEDRDLDLDLGGVDGDFMALYDAAGNKYTGEAELKSNGAKSLYLTLKPGQGVGQPALDDPYRVAFKVPLDAVVTKVMVAQPRVGKDETVLRYVLDPEDKAFDPVNRIAPLPPEVRDPKDKTGAVALKAGTGKVGTAMPAGPFRYEVVKVEPSVASLSEKLTPEEGHRYVVVSMRITNVDPREQSTFDALPRDAYVLDGDGDRHPVAAFLKGASEEEPSGEMAQGQPKTLRVLFDLAKSAKLQSLTLAGSYYPWTLDLTGLQGRV